MKRDKVVEMIIDIKRMIELNKESIKMQEERKNQAMVNYLQGWNQAYESLLHKLEQEC
jgi:hypothetical protein